VFVFTSPLYLKGKPFTQDVVGKGYIFQVIYSLLPVYNSIFRKNSQKFAKIRFKSYNSTANFSIFEIRIFRIDSRCALCPSQKTMPLRTVYNGQFLVEVAVFNRMMMMIAFITFNSSLVPLFEGL